MVLFPVLVSAQAPVPSKQARVTNKPSDRSVADAVMAEKRQVAISLLTSMAIEARSYRDEGLRARVQARVADALWDQQKEKVR
jgi:hypothetical protein